MSAEEKRMITLWLFSVLFAFLFGLILMKIKSGRIRREDQLLYKLKLEELTKQIQREQNRDRNGYFKFDEGTKSRDTV